MLRRWTPPTKDKPGVESKPFFSPTPEDIRTLIFDYLCQNAFTSTARTFVKDTAIRHLDSDGDEIMASSSAPAHDPLAETMEERLEQAELRRDIRVNILSGRVDDAISLLNAHFPSVLSLDVNMEGASQSSNDPALSYIPPSSVDPAHLLLNLRILGFIEAARTVPLPYHHPGSKVPLSPSLPTTPFSEDSMTVPANDPECDERQMVLLHKAQKLYWEANCLPDASDRGVYLKELGQVTGLLAYPQPEKSIMAPYLSQQRREGVANQIEGAILYRTKQSAVSRIELAARCTTTIWQFLHDEDDVLMPPRNKWPPGVQPPPLPKSTRDTVAEGEPEADSGAGKKSPEQGTSEHFPLFDLTEFLNAKSKNQL